MSTTPGQEPDEALAAELALGLLDDEERRAAEQRRRDDPRFAALCARWEELAARWLDDGAADPPAPQVWARISDRLPANDGAEARRLRRDLGRWRGGAIAMAALAAGLGLFAVRLENRPPPVRVVTRTVPAGPPIVAVLTGEQGRGVLSVSIDRATGRITVARQAFDFAGRSAQLWVIPADKVPRSLGLLPPDPSSHGVAAGRSELAIAPGMVLAVSLEPTGGSRTGKPTGPIVLKGVA